MANILKDSKTRNVIIIDARYPYEYEGGHISTGKILTLIPTVDPRSPEVISLMSSELATVTGLGIYSKSFTESRNISMNPTNKGPVYSIPFSANNFYIQKEIDDFFFTKESIEKDRFLN